MMHLQFWPNIFQTKPFYKHKQKTKHFISEQATTHCLKAIGYALPLFIGPSKGKKSFVPFLAKAVLAFYTISRSCSCTCFTEYKELNLDALVVNRWSYIIISEKGFFFSLYYLLSYHLLLLLSPFFTSKKFSRQPKKISRFYFFFALLAWHLCGL